MPLCVEAIAFESLLLVWLYACVNGCMRACVYGYSRRRICLSVLGT